MWTQTSSKSRRLTILYYNLCLQARIWRRSSNTRHSQTLPCWSVLIRRSTFSWDVLVLGYRVVWRYNNAGRGFSRSRISCDRKTHDKDCLTCQSFSLTESKRVCRTFSIVCVCVCVCADVHFSAAARAHPGVCGTLFYYPRLSQCWTEILYCFE